MATWISRPELAALIGADAARTLCRLYGGVSQHIPYAAAPDHPWSRVIGMAAMRAVCAAHGGTSIVPPNGRQPEPHKQAIVKMLAAGHSHRAIALELGVTERWVQMVANATRGPAQLPLPYI